MWWLRSYADSIVSSAEDPEKLLDQTVREMQEDLIKMKQTSATVIASQKSMEAKYAQASKTANEWYSRAQLALEKGWGFRDRAGRVILCDRGRGIGKRGTQKASIVSGQCRINEEAARLSSGGSADDD